MPRYWLMAPFKFDAGDSQVFDRVWEFDLANNVISMGWSDLGDISKIDYDSLRKVVAYPDNPPQTNALIANMLWNFYHEMKPGDLVIARKGRKIIAGVGRVTEIASYQPSKNPSIKQSGFLGVQWQEKPRNKVFPKVVFTIPTLIEITESKFQSFLEGIAAEQPIQQSTEPLEDPNAFVLEKYLENFIVTNFQTIFKGKLVIHEDAAGNFGQQYATDIGSIDILATEPQSSAFVVIELKKGRPSDQVVGQVLRYMGWVKQNLCKPPQTVKGLVICHDRDQKLEYALAMTKDIEVKYYQVSFKLSEIP